MVTVAVMPLRSDASKMRESDVTYEYIRGSGPGGQNRNKVCSTVRATHKPTGISVKIDNRDQHKNKCIAFDILTARVNKHYQDQTDRQYDQDRQRQRDGGGRGNKIRTYNLFKGYVLDHRTGREAPSKQIMKGRFELLA